MPAPAYPLPKSLPPIQLYRHLLREVSYLPPAFRPVIASTLRTRFHKPQKDGVHTKSRLSHARSALRNLRAANSGDKMAMQNLMLTAFGRIGRRRRELMSILVMPGARRVPSDTKELESLMERARNEATPTPDRKPKHAFLDKWELPKLLRNLESQKQHQRETKHSTSWPNRAVKLLDPDQNVPKTNIWGNPPAESLVRTKRANWWKTHADKIMPPIRKWEWDLLQRLGNGAQEQGEWTVPHRRHYPSEEATSQVNKWNWESYATAPAARVELPRSMPRQRRTGQRDTGPYGGRERGKQVSNRWFRRAYNRTWQLTPTAVRNPDTHKDTLMWGKPFDNLPTATAAQLGIFKGVDKRGNRIQERLEF